jgi:hypothetical protein
MRFSPLPRRGTAARALALAPACAIVLGGLLAAPASAAMATTGPAATAAPTATVWTARTGTVPLASVNVIKPSVTAAGVKEYHIKTGGLLSGIHKCVNLGTDGTYQGVVCADLWAQPSGNAEGDIFVSPALEAYCQVGSTTTIKTCSSIDAFEFSANAFQLEGPPSGAQCGAGFAACPANQRYELIGQHLAVTNGCGGTGSDNEVWTVVEAGTKVDLPSPSFKNLTLGTNLASQHAIVCP